MAAFTRHGAFKTAQLVSTKNVLIRSYGTRAIKKKDLDKKVGPKIEYTAQSLATKGFLRAQKEYVPPHDICSILDEIFKTEIGDTCSKTELEDIDQRFKLFFACSNKIGHSIPNSLLHDIKTLGDVKNFYETPVDVRTPLDKLKDIELPENLHVQFEYHRFHPDTDTLFKGITAFNESSTIVTGLKYKGKYPGHVQKQKYPV